MDITLLDWQTAACEPGMTLQGGLDKLAGAAATIDALSQDAQQQRIQLRASQVYRWRLADVWNCLRFTLGWTCKGCDA